jgi:hypothetical protein
MKTLHEATIKVERLAERQSHQPKILLLSDDKGYFQGLSFPIEENDEDDQRRENA